MSNDESQKINSGNRLTDETSPYLLQHAHNPVAWYPWGNEALELARERGVPILLSIGYSACHWCHVMEHESFEDDDVAAVMNENFVCIKVDREERPDLDRIYQLSHQMMTRRGGGWPLTIFLTPNGHAPLFAGTYFPKTPRHGMPGFVDVMLKVQDHYEKHGHDLESHDAAFRDALAQTTESEGDKALTTELLKQAGNELALSYDSEHGGFGNAPKFPHPTHLDVLLRLDARETKDARPVSSQATPKKMLVHTLEAMAAGGLYDHLGGGFCRYSVDERWEIPHFEKMLYDNAQLLALYAEAWHLTKAPAFKTVCEETVRWIRMQMQASDGGYFSTVDADSEGEEGKFYVWTPAAVQALLTESEFALVKTHYGLDRPANFEGAWHLSIKVPYDDLAGKHNLSAGDIDASLLSARRKLEKERATRIPPSLDDKILTSWNGLMIRGMARAGHLLDEPTWIDSAIAAVDFVKDTLWQDGRLLATTRRGKTHLNAYLDDYVYLIDGLIELMQARWRDEDLEFAQALAESVLEHFQDTESGGFFFTSDDHERLLHRPKPGMDDATPSGNGIAALVFTRLGHLVGDVRYLKAAEDTFNFLSSGMTQYPSAFGSALVALEEHLIPTETVMIRYEKNSNVMAWQQVVRDTRRLNRLVVAIPSSAVSLPGVLADRHARADVTAYVCRGLSCDAPITALEPFREALTLSEPNTQ